MNISQFCIYSIPFFIVAAMHLILCSAEKEKLCVITKPLLMPLLILAVFLYVKFVSQTLELRFALLIGALFFGWIGDIFLLGSTPSQNNFARGVVFFLLGHVLYIIILFHIYDFSHIQLAPFVIVSLLYIFIVYIISTKFNLPKGLFGKLIIIYAVILCMSSFLSIIMLTSYSNIRSATTQIIDYSMNIKTIMLLLGGVSFAISDSVLSYITFNHRFKYCDTLVMVTYLLAQFLLALGICIW